MNRKEIKEIDAHFNRACSIKMSVNLLMSEVNKECMDYLRGILKQYNGRIEFHIYDEHGIQEDDTSFCVSYDGGHHPEYASNVFSEVSAIWEKNGHIYLEVEEENQYEINRIDIYSIYDLCEHLYNVIIPMLENK